MPTILIVDDDAEIREMLVIHLTTAGYPVLTAGNGREALQLIAQSDLGIDLVLTDMFMPEKDGVEVVIDCNKRGLPVIGMSGGDRRGQQDTLRAAVHLGAAHTLHKPFSGDELLALVAAALRGK